MGRKSFILRGMFWTQRLLWEQADKVVRIQNRCCETLALADQKRVLAVWLLLKAELRAADLYDTLPGKQCRVTMRRFLLAILRGLRATAEPPSPESERRPFRRLA